MKLRSPSGRVSAGITLLIAIVAAMSAVVATAASPDTHSPRTPPKWTVGVSNTLVGNGWREQMICSVKAQSKANGNVDKVVVSNINGGPAEQIAGIRNLISAGADAIIINPSDRKALNGVIAQAHSRGIVVVAVDQAVTSQHAYIVTNDQVAYGRLGATWLFKQLGGRGNVVEMRGIAGVPADTDRHKGFLQAKRRYPNIKVVKSVFTGWQFAPGGKQMLDILNSGVRVDGVWTSGIDYTVVNAFRTARKPYKPVVGADNNAFLKQLITLQKSGFVGAAVTNPAVVGAAGTKVALDVLSGRRPKRIHKLVPQVWDMKTEGPKIRRFYSAKRAPTYSSQLFIPGYTNYTEKMLTGCQGP